MFSPHITYCPIFSIAKYKKFLLLKYEEDKVNNHLTEMRKQIVTQILYLPQNKSLKEDCFARLDMANSLPLTGDLYPKVSNKLSTFSNYDFYLFLFKISIYFTQIQENLVQNNA